MNTTEIGPILIMIIGVVTMVCSFREKDPFSNMYLAGLLQFLIGVCL